MHGAPHSEDGRGIAFCSEYLVAPFHELTLFSFFPFLLLSSIYIFVSLFIRLLNFIRLTIGTTPMEPRTS